MYLRTTMIPNFDLHCDGGVRVERCAKGDEIGGTLSSDELYCCEASRWVRGDERVSGSGWKRLGRRGWALHKERGEPHDRREGTLKSL